MLSVDEIGNIRRARFRKGRSIRGISRDLGISRTTVRKVLRSGATPFGVALDCGPGDSTAVERLGDFVSKALKTLSRESGHGESHGFAANHSRNGKGRHLGRIAQWFEACGAQGCACWRAQSNSFELSLLDAALRKRRQQPFRAERKGRRWKNSADQSKRHMIRGQATRRATNFSKCW